MEILIVTLVVIGATVLVWAIARSSEGYRDKDLQYNPNSLVPATEEDRIKRLSAIVAAAVMAAYGLAVVAAIAMRG